jgi:hypothetical protein
MNESLHLTDEQLDRARAGLDAGSVAAQHVAGCARCLARLRAWDRLRVAPSATLQQQLAERRTVALASGRRVGRARWHYPAAIAAMLVAVGVGLFVFLSPGHQDTMVAEQGQTEAVPDVYADLDFYLWLSKQDAEEKSESHSS